MEYDKEYYLKNRAKVLSRVKGYYQKNKEKIIAKIKERNLKDKDKVSVRQKEYYLKNKEKILSKTKKYKLKNKEKVIEYILKNKDKLKVKRKIFYLNNKEKILVKAKEYRLKNPELQKKDSLKRREKRALLRNKRIAAGLQSIAHTTAGLGGRYWTKEKIFEDVLKYKIRTEWHRASPSAVDAAKKLGIYKDATKHMFYAGSRFRRCVYTILLPKQKLAYIGLTFNFKRRSYEHLQTKRFKDLITFYGRESIEMKKITEYLDIEEAVKYEAKLINDFKIDGWKMLNKTVGGEVGATAKKWTREKILETTIGYNSFRKWREDNEKAYNAVRHMGVGNLLKEIRKILPEDYWNRKIIRKWTKEAVLKEALKFKTRSQWLKFSEYSYHAAKRYKCFEEAVRHMKPWGSK